MLRYLLQVDILGYLIIVFNRLLRYYHTVPSLVGKNCGTEVSTEKSVKKTTNIKTVFHEQIYMIYLIIFIIIRLYRVSIGIPLKLFLLIDES